jgi:hypothetical protein
LLRPRLISKQEEDHVRQLRAMPLRARHCRNASQVNRLTVVAGKSSVPVGFGYGRKNTNGEVS